MELDQIKKQYDKYVLATYARTDLCLVKGKDTVVEDINGKKYLDFFPGWVVSGVGHRNSYVVKRMKDQMDKIFHVSNNYYNELQGELSQKIIENSFKGKVFYGNSGAEANEGAIKLARKYGSEEGRYEIITMTRSFHGRTMATLSATGQDKVKKGFAPLLEGFIHVPFNDIDAVKKAITKKTVAVMLEPIQGEGGINIADKKYMKQLRDLCDEKKILLILDEVQTAMGRTGKMFGYKYFGITPDIMTLAKSLGGGLPIGAFVVRSEFADVLQPGNHGSTFGGSPLICAAALGVFDSLTKGGLLKQCNIMSSYFKKRLIELKKKQPIIKTIKIVGLMIGLEIAVEDASNVYKKCLEKGLLINCTQGNILRIMPPLCVTKAQADKAIKILEDVLSES
ncbi:MAG: aspartate aminotransferase family protein [Candidatus Omnitrophica bacterium]|nr:aspartate aminotransferase family protein [Candidatus Omnitrophota bacterium]